MATDPNQTPNPGDQDPNPEEQQPSQEPNKQGVASGNDDLDDVVDNLSADNVSGDRQTLSGGGEADKKGVTKSEAEESESKDSLTFTERQENTRSMLAMGIAAGLGGILFFLLTLNAANQVGTYLLLRQAGDLKIEKLAEIKKEQDQASMALMNLIITAGFSTLGTALGFYFSNSRSEN
ncbi:hypothetical protein [Leptolyngbya sp. PCC 6406]|uniref:hypothetical protein n=1 Tax=Leptolyngbya sp. PCC 6406 TaxID=1173264 RepID=UPI0002ABB22F|nr:hypothetical protein [Leptolyngbya sp. PCC 6406]